MPAVTIAVAEHRMTKPFNMPEFVAGVHTTGRVLAVHPSGQGEKRCR
jgi:hypothetical protein